VSEERVVIRREFVEFLVLLGKESERGAVVIAATLIDDLLGQTILAFLVDHKEAGRLLDGFNAPLGTFASRILAAFALGLLSEEEYRECENIRKVRNIFAHNIHTSFGDQKVKDLCAKLKCTATKPGYGQVEPRDFGQFRRRRRAFGSNGGGPGI
jgi:mannitol operon repressor